MDGAVEAWTVGDGVDGAVEAWTVGGWRCHVWALVSNEVLSASAAAGSRFREV